MNLPVGISTLQDTDCWVGAPTSLHCLIPCIVCGAFAEGTRSLAAMACSPMRQRNNNRQSVCRNNLCMHAITVDQVLEQIRCIYQSRSNVC